MQSRYQSLTAEMRTRFKRDAVRNVDGQSKEQAIDNVRAREHEGEGTVVVSIVVAAKGTIKDVPTDANAAHIDSLLAELSAIDATRLVALEVIWSPAVEADRMSTLELEQFYPELRKLDEASIGGRVFCAFCKGPYASELPTCPHCGAARTA